MKHSTPSPNKADRERFDAFQKIGCIACRMRERFSYADVHHLLSGGRRRGHRYTIPLCPWHHKGETTDDTDTKWCEAFFGPSLARTPNKFRAEFGTDEQLLTKVDRLIGAVT